MEELLGIGLPASTKPSVGPQVLVHNSNLLSFGIEICYNLAPSPGRLVSLWGRRSFADELLRESAITNEIYVSSLVEESS